MRQRPTHAKSTSAIIPTTSPLSPPTPTAASTTTVSARPRAYTLHHTASDPFPTSSSETTTSEWNLSVYLLRRVDAAERGVKDLAVMIEHSGNESSSSGSSMRSGSSGSSNDEEEEESEEEEWKVVVRSRSRRRSPGQSIVTAPVNAIPVTTSASTSVKPDDNLPTLQHFILTAQNFLLAIRSELPPALPSLAFSIPSSPSMIRFQLSPEARLALDHFLEEHLPSLPAIVDLKSAMDDSKKACYARVTLELVALQHLFAQLTTNASLTVDNLLPAISAITPSEPVLLSSMREYFVSESDRLAQTLSSISSSTSNNLISLSTDAADTLSAGFTRVVDEASELTSLLTSSSTAAFDEAARIYHAAVEGGRNRLLRYEELPQQWKNNQHILSGYRFIGIDRWGAILRSAFQFHNETINIHSHFFGFLSLLYLAIFILPYSPAFTDGNHWGDKAIFIVFIGAGMKCLLCSTAWHLLSGCATGGWHRGAACVDYVGISGLIAASVMGMEYYGLYCRSDLARNYMILSGALGLTGMVLPWRPWFNMRKYKMWRVAFFVGLALSALMPLGHMGFLYGFKETLDFFSPVIPSIAAYLIGLSFYANQFPECAAPGRWDTLCASHQVWHAAIVLAVWAHWRAMNLWATNGPTVTFSCAVRP